MTRSELVVELARRRGLSRRSATKVVDSMLDGLVQALCSGQRVELRGFGTLKPRHYPSREGRNPRSGERVQVSHKVLPVFRPGRALLRVVNSSDHGVSRGQEGEST